MPNKCNICKQDLALPNPNLFKLPTITSDCRPWHAGRSAAWCKGCGLLQRVGEMGGVYEGYGLSLHGANAARTRRILDALQFPLPSSILDVGCGNGAGLDVMRDKFPHAAAYGYDPHGTFDGCLRQKPDAKYDLITMFQVLEHVINPADELNWIAEHLTHNGLLLIGVPYCTKWPFDFIIADHVWHFTMHSLSRMLYRHGFEVLRIGNCIVEKELTCLAAYTGKRAERPAAEDDCIACATDWILDYKEFLDKIDEPVAVFGTAPPSAWVGSVLGDKVACYIDDDSAIHGNLLNGRIISDAKTADCLPVVAPFYDRDFDNVKRKHPKLKFLGK